MKFIIHCICFVVDWWPLLGTIYLLDATGNCGMQHSSYFRRFLIHYIIISWLGARFANVMRFMAFSIWERFGNSSPPQNLFGKFAVRFVFGETSKKPVIVKCVTCFSHLCRQRITRQKITISQLWKKNFIEEILGYIEIVSKSSYNVIMNSHNSHSQ